MIMRVSKITVILISFIFLNGFIPFVSLLGPSLTAATSGNIYKAGIQYTLNKTIKDKTGNLPTISGIRPKSFKSLGKKI